MKKPRLVERYEAERSPLAQKPTQARLAILIGFKKPELKAIALHKNEYIVRRTIERNGKTRALAYPIRKLRRVHERLKYHCNKIKLPPYLYSPRSGRAQRDNALLHVGQRQYLTLDIKQFYPSTSREHVFRWALRKMGMLTDVAALFTELVTVDDTVSFGSPLTPVLTALIHQDMFDAIYGACASRGLRFSLWVDDIVISGNFVPGELLNEIRSIINSNGLRSHKLEYKTGNRTVIITGIPVNGKEIGIPKFIQDSIRYNYAELRNIIPNDDEDSDTSYEHIIIDKLLSALGTYRYIAGRNTRKGLSASAKMAALRRRRAALPLQATTAASSSTLLTDCQLSGTDLNIPFDLD